MSNGEDKPQDGETVVIRPKHGGILKPFRKGQCGNPKGRPLKDLDLIAAIHDHARRKAGFSELIHRLYREDLRTYLAYGWGKPIERHEVVSAIVHGDLTPEVMALARAIAFERGELKGNNGNGHIDDKKGD